MKDSLLNNLQQLVSRHEEISGLLSDPEIISDQNRFRDLSREYSRLEPVAVLLAKFEQHPLRPKFPPFAGFREIESRSYYGTGYQDVQYRRPSIENAKNILTDLFPKIESLNHDVREDLAAEFTDIG